jgi:tRNA (cytidine56-2'-O)-methyltransferase
VWVLRLTHRVERDRRVSTHLALVSRAFGADGLFYSGVRDPVLEDKVMDVSRRWGGGFRVVYVSDPYSVVEDWRGEGGIVVHLTMYGLPLPEVIGEIRGRDMVLVIVGSEKVDSRFFDISDYNVSVTSQPHSEIAALALFLDRYFEGGEFGLSFPGGRYRVVPTERGKKVVKLG